MPAGLQTTRSRSKKPSAFDVAREAGVSQTTVSFVMNGSTSPKISEATTKRVMDAIEKLGYRPNTLARSLAHGKSHTVGVLLPYLDSGYHQQLVAGLQEALHDQGYYVLFVYAVENDDMERRLVEFLLQHRVDAMACFLPIPSFVHVPSWLKTLEHAGVPATIIDNSGFCKYVDCAMSDDYAGMKDVVGRLYEQGHRRISLLAGCWPSDMIPDRVDGFGKALMEYGLTYDVRLGADRDMTQEEYSNAMVALLEGSNPPTAFVAQLDFMFEHFLMFEAGHRYRIPEDVSLVGYGNTYLSKITRLSSVHQNPEFLGRAIAKRLLARLDNPDLPVQKITAPTTFIDRGSIGTPKPMM
ncbi:MAG TPA: LacI family DNA-binding transcriptional regulator [Capsulimonadaceae bacterium]|jgi:LacI family transcriptional regulator